MSEKFEKLQARVVEAYSKAEAGAAAGQIAVGIAAHKAVRAKLADAPPKSARGFRAEAIESLSKALGEAGHKVLPTHLNRSIRVSQVALLLGPTEAKGLPVRSLFALTRLVRRDSKKEEYSLTPKHAQEARALFARAVAGEANPSEVSQKVDTILGVKPKEPKPKPTPVDRIVTALEKASEKELTAALRSLQLDSPDQFKIVLKAFRPLAPAQKPKPTPPPPVEPPSPLDNVESKTKKGIFGSRAA